MSNIPSVEHDNNSTDALIKAAAAFGRTTFQGVFIMDCQTLAFLYVSDNPLFLCGHTAQEVQDSGLKFYREHIPQKDLSLLTELTEAFTQLLLEQPIEERLEYTFSCDYHLMNKKQLLLVHLKLTALDLTPDGKVSQVMSVVSYSPLKDPGPILAMKTGSNTYWEYSRENHRWIKHIRGMLSEEERRILLLSAQGYKMEEIAEKMFKSIDTVKFYKRRLFEKMEVDNITEAFAYALIYRLI